MSDLADSLRYQHWNDDAGIPGAKVLALIEAAFGGAESLWPANLRWAAWDEGHLVAHVATQRRWFIVNGTYLEGWFIGSMCTHPDLQRRGIGARLLNVALGDLRRMALRFAVLNCGQNKANFYEKAGFCQIAQSGAYFRKGKAETDHGDPAMAICLDPQFDIGALHCEIFPFGFDF